MLKTVFLIVIYGFISSADFYKVHSICAEEFYFMF